MPSKNKSYAKEGIENESINKTIIVFKICCKLVNTFFFHNRDIFKFNIVYYLFDNHIFFVIII